LSPSLPPVLRVYRALAPAPSLQQELAASLTSWIRAKPWWSSPRRSTHARLAGSSGSSTRIVRREREYLWAGLPGNWIAEPAGVMARRADVIAVGGYNLRVRQNNDVDLWLRLMARGDVAFIDRPLYEYRLGFSGVTGGSAARERQWLDPLWTAEGLAQMPSFPEPAELAAARRRLLVKAVRRVAVSPVREPRDAFARLADLASYCAYRLARARGPGTPSAPPIAL
jgi:hypothetical protein